MNRLFSFALLLPLSLLAASKCGGDDHPHDDEHHHHGDDEHSHSHDDHEHSEESHEHE